MTQYEIKVIPAKGEPRVMSFEDAERFSIMVNSYLMHNIRIEYNRELVVPVSMRLPRNANYVGD